MAQRDLASIKKRHYRLMHRTPEAYTQPTDAATFATFLATMSELGYCRDKTLKLTFEPSEEEVLDTGKKKFMGWNGRLEGTLIETEAANYTYYEAIENAEEDLFLYSEVSEMCIFFANGILVFGENLVSGETENIPFYYEASDLATKAAFRDRFAEPLT